MLCSEKVEHVYKARPEYAFDAICFLDYLHHLELFLSDRCRMILETANFYICLETEGVFLHTKTGPVESIVKEDDWVISCIQADFGEDPWIEYPQTLLEGELLCAVEPAQQGYNVQFTDFTLKVTPVVADAYIFERMGKRPEGYTEVLASRRLLRKCVCGGSGRLFTDSVDDFIVACNRCDLKTWAGMCANDAITDWNEHTNLHMCGEAWSE